MAKPSFETGFLLPQGGTIFTIGSCFARNIEKVLEDRGFKLPAVEVLETVEDFKALGRGVLNNYGAPSIYNELKWAFEDDDSDDVQFCAMGNGWVDLHLLSTMRPADLETVRMRRRALRDSYRSISRCDAVIITLGLSEVWFDTETGYYLNMAPRRALLRAFPERFELHVLSYSETLEYLQKAIDLIKTHGKEGIQVVVTVSPVPLTATYRASDVMVANSYSKSVLRTAAEELVQTHDFVHYFPSYESITLSERSAAYSDDEVHVTQEIVDLNVGRMVQAYTGEDKRATIEDIRADLETFRSHPKIGYETLRNYTDYCHDPQIAAALTECAIAAGEWDVAQVALALSHDPDGVLSARILMAQNQPEQALLALNGTPEDPRQRAESMRIRIRASVATGAYDAAEEAANGWADAAPHWTVPLKVMASALAQADDPRATLWFERAVEVSNESPGSILDMAEYLLRLGKVDDARARLAAIEKASDREMHRKSRLLKAI